MSGDLLEEYCVEIVPSRGRARADRWYIREVVGFALRRIGPWSALFAVAFLVRTALDWLLPASDFRLRADISTSIGVGTLLFASFRAASRSGSYAAGPLVGAATAAFAAPMSVVGVAALLALSHDAATFEAIRRSGGLAEALALPVMMVVPGMVVGAIGGALGITARRLSPA